MKRFDEFWKIYPRRVAKGTARKAWAKAVQLREALADAIKSGDAEFEARVRSEAAKEGVELK